MVRLYGGDGQEALGYFIETFGFGHFGSLGVELHTFLLLFGCRDGEILDRVVKLAGVYSHRRIGDTAVHKILQEYLAVAEFVGGSLVDYIGVLEVFVFFGLLRIICIAGHGH